ncbi:hypothetical protein AGLY_013813 [Aphis glycines]|uniref:Uncharacterized protein n=1 Tax=Aphis glycines TaxID=307491 RepID=A0A6G0T6G4_APHGL|nr:hypothetical protein AGLY_013813 [Aphis glycines]
MDSKIKGFDYNDELVISLHYYLVKLLNIIAIQRYPLNKCLVLRNRFQLDNNECIMVFRVAQNGTMLITLSANETETFKLTEISFRAIMYLCIFYIIPEKEINSGRSDKCIDFATIDSKNSLILENGKKQKKKKNRKRGNFYLFKDITNFFKLQMFDWILQIRFHWEKLKFLRAVYTNYDLFVLKKKTVIDFYTFFFRSNKTEKVTYLVFSKRSQDSYQTLKLTTQIGGF